MKQCGKCRSALYCSKSCQKAHLGYHAVFCSAIVDLKNLERNKLYGNYTVSQNSSNYKTKMKLASWWVKSQC